ncbi:MAG TPA: TonB-dependent receptor [Micropepsaceae bacterium]|nr:TonB-dependent receptor [Micropepsaceae bacterium]
MTTGASATYGSDAVAGVVNFILKDHLEGFVGNAQYGTSQYGDENQIFGSAGWGTTLLNGRGHFIIGGEFANEYNTVNMYARPWGRKEPPVTQAVTLTPAQAKALGQPTNIFGNNTEVANGTEGGLITACQGAGGAAVANCPLIDTTFSAAGTPSAFQRGAISGSTFMFGTGNYGVSSMNRQLAPPYKRWAGLTRFEYDLTPDITAYAMLNYGELESDDPSGGSPFPINLKISSGNPFIPASVQAAMTANNISSVTLAKENIDGIGLGNTAENKNILVQSFFGVKGTLFGDWDWNAQGSAGRATVWQAFLNVPVIQNFNTAANAVKDASGNIVCGPASAAPFTNSGATAAQLAAAPSPGCVPYNPFGVPSAGSVQYITTIPTGPDGSEANMRQYMGQIDLSGPVFNLPAGAVALALGGNYRYNSYDQRGTQAAVQNLYQTRNPPSFFINQSVWEAYSEVGVPILRDLPFVRALDLNAAGRYTNYSITGGVYTWKYGGTWDVTDWLRLRATRSQDIRAPNFTELAITPTSSATNLSNPLNNQSLRVSNIQTTGNPDLRPEVAQNETFGFVFQPGDSFLPGFRASVDYYRIRIAGQITAVPAQDVVNRCLVQQLVDFCSQLTWAPTLSPQVDPNAPWLAFANGQNAKNFGIQSIHLFSVNLNAELQDGVDVNISERLPLDAVGALGTLQLSALGSYINQQTLLQSQSNGTTARVNLADSWTAPRWSANFNITYLLDRFTGNLQVRYYSPLKYVAGNTFLIGPDDPQYTAAIAAGSTQTTNRETWPAAVTLNLSLAYDVIQEPSGQDLQVYFNIDNLLDTPPPLVWPFLSTYDVMGRFFKIGVRYTLP